MRLAWEEKVEAILVPDWFSSMLHTKKGRAPREIM